MKYNPNKHRHSIRIPGYDYSRPGYYFITMCTQNMKHIFGKIKGGEMVLNEFGQTVKKEWLKTPEIRKEILLDKFIVMPNHLHGIIIINVGVNSVRPYNQSAGERHSPLQPPQMKPKSISSFVAGFKAAVTKQINNFRKTSGLLIWQRNFYEHVIRNEESLNRIRNYILNNPLNWENDIENRKSGEYISKKELENYYKKIF